MPPSKNSSVLHPLDGAYWQDELTKQKALDLVAYHVDQARTNATALEVVAAAVQDAYARGRKDQQGRGYRLTPDEPVGGWDPR